MKLLIFCALLVAVDSQFDVVSRYPLVESFDQEKCLKMFAPKDLRDGIKKMANFLSAFEDIENPFTPRENVYLLNNDIGDQNDWQLGKLPYVMKSKLSEFSSHCKRHGGTLPSPDSDSGLATLKKWLSAIDVAANIVLPIVSGEQ